MKMNKKWKLFTACLAAVLCLTPSLSLLPAKAAEIEEEIPEDAVHITSVRDLQELSENCVLDTWSQGITVLLDADLNLANISFTPIPTFGGIFLGQGHTISGLTIDGGSSYMGLFRYIQESGEIHDLNLSGSANADSTHSGLSLLAGCNMGLISGCSVTGSIDGGDDVGMITSYNKVTGVIDSCTVQGTVYGNHRTGGIAGINEGTILSCNNKCSVNTTVSDDEIQLSTLTVDDIFTTENASAVTDIGGIAGSSSGVIRACVNNGSVGYQHVGYNIGGIAGSQTGYMEGCINYGILNGRKDVGGIVGQMEPSSEIEYLEDTLDKLNTEFNKLHGLVTKMTEDAGNTSSRLTTQMDCLLTSVEDAQNAVDNILSQTSTDMNDFSGKLTDISSLPSPEPISLAFLDELPSPSLSPLPSGTADASSTPAETPDASAAPSSTPTETPGSADDADAVVSPSATPGLLDRLDENVNTDVDLDNLPDTNYNFDREKAEEEINKVQDNVYTDASEVMDSTKNTLSNEVSLASARLETYRLSLNSSFSAVVTNTKILNTMVNEENQLLLDDFQAITDEVNVIENLITDPDTPDPDDIVSDVSDEDTEKDITGKVMNCVNRGKIYGDLNIGGIAGAMSRENDLDPEDDFNLLDDASSLNLRYKERMVIRQSQNYGVIEGKKDCVGGIVGDMTLGSIIDCIGSGDVSSSGDMIGGIAGQAEGSIRGSSAKCALSGENQIGGIAGSGTAIADCYSMIEIKSGKNFLGSIAGKAELSEDIHDNYFVAGTPAGIDGVSYTGIAEPLPYADFMYSEDLPDVYQNIYLTFMADDRIVSTVTLSYGESFDVNKLPAVPKKEGYFGEWEDFEASSLTFDQTINAVYSEYISTLESLQTTDGKPEALVEGCFESGDRFILSEMDAYPEDAKTKAVCRKITISGGTAPYTVRYLIPEDMENPVLELYQGNAFVPVSGSIDGSYYVFTADSPSFIFCLTERPDSSAKKIIPVCIAGLAVLIGIAGLHKKAKKKKGSPKA